MKRTPFTRKPLPEHISPPLVPLVRGVCYDWEPVGGVGFAKDETPHSLSYRMWVAGLPCIVCGLEGFSQAAHPNQGRGLGQKASDLDCFPLCCTRSGYPGHHWEHDNLYQMTLEERRERELDYTARTRALAIEVGRPEIAA